MARVLQQPGAELRLRTHWTESHRARRAAGRGAAAGRLPCAAAAHHPAQGAAGQAGRVRRPGQLHRLRADAGAAGKPVEQHLGVGAGHRHRRAAGLRLRLRAHALLHAVQAAVSRHHAGAAAGAVAAVGHLADLLVRQPGRAQGLDDRPRHRRDLWRAGHRHRRVLRGVPACADDPGHRAQPVGRAPVRSRRRHGHQRRRASSSPSRCPAPSTA